ncbi:MAG TPA: translational GTPase TypA, partial [Faecalibacter sp.]
LIETMRREGYELTVGQPQVIFKEIDGVKCEPYETLVIDVPDDYSSKAIDLVTQRKGDLLVMEAKEGMQHLEFEIPSRGLIGLRSLMLTSTAGEAVMAHNFLEYKPFKGAIAGRSAGVIISKDQGVATPYSIDKLQDRGKFFIEPGEEVYEGMIVGEHSRNNDLVVNVIEAKKLNNIRAAGKDDSSSIAPKIEMTLEECMEYIQADECIEVTPNYIRLRKIHLKETDRKRYEKSMG